MPIKTTYEKISHLRDLSPKCPGPLSRLANTDDKTSFGHRVQISRFLKPVVEAIREYEKSFLELLLKYGEPMGGDNFKISKENMKTYQSELRDLLSVEIEISVLPLSQAVLENTSLTSKDISLFETSGLFLLMDPAG